MLNVAIVGTGYFSQFHFEAWLRLTDVKIVAVCSRNVSEAESVANSYGVEHLFGDVVSMLDKVKPDLIDIVTPPSAHGSIIRDAQELGVPVVCQKPFTNSLDEARNIAALSEKTGVPIIVHENFRFQPWYLEIKKQLDANLIGKPYQVTFRLRPGDGQGSEAYLDRQPYFQTMNKFLIHETAVHFIDVFRFLFGEVNQVYADLRTLNPVISGEDAGLVIFSFRNGVVGVFDGNRLSDHAAENCRLTMGEMIVEGSAGVISLHGNGQVYFRAHGEQTGELIPYQWEDTGFAGDCVFNLQEHVVDCINNNRSVSNNVKEYLTNLVVEDAIYQSQESGCKVTVCEQAEI